MDITAIAVLIPVIIGITGTFKEVGMPSKLAPILCLVLGYVFVGLLTKNWGSTGILVGITTGLAATGGHSGVSATVDGIKGLMPN